jgi:hypothetical protein
VGGVTPGAGNVLSGNSFFGVDIVGSGSDGNVVRGNLIGTDIHGTAPVGNAGGIEIYGGPRANTVGGAAAGAANVISANGFGMFLYATSGNVVAGNRVGTDATGRAPLGNQGDGVQLENTAGNTVGGTAAGAGNVISANVTNGLLLSSASGEVVCGNLIGTDVSGTTGLGNGFDGVFLNGVGNTIGGTAAGAANVISANSWNGLEIAGDNTSGNAVLGNLIGTDRRARASLGNGRNGVLIRVGATATTVGGTASGAGNAIAFNAKGVVVADTATTGASVLGDRIWGNAGPGIDLGDDGPTPNGANPRAFPNDGQNTPTITGLTVNNVSGTLTSVPKTRFRLEFFASPVGGAPYQGQVFLGSLYVTTNAAGSVAFTAPVAAIPPGAVVTATATNLTSGDTSEFSQVRTQLLVTSDPVLTIGSQMQLITLSAQLFNGNMAVTSGQVTFRIAGLPGQATGTVNAAGVVAVQFVVPPGAPAGPYLITATFGGGEDTDAASGDAILTVIRPAKKFGRLL